MDEDIDFCNILKHANKTAWVIPCSTITYPNALVNLVAKNTVRKLSHCSYALLIWIETIFPRSILSKLEKGVATLKLFDNVYKNASINSKMALENMFWVRRIVSEVVSVQFSTSITTFQRLRSILAALSERELPFWTLVSVLSMSRSLSLRLSFSYAA